MFFLIFSNTFSEYKLKYVFENADMIIKKILILLEIAQALEDFYAMKLKVNQKFFFKYNTF